MILPPHDPATGLVAAEYVLGLDARVPDYFSIGLEVVPAVVLGFDHTSERCPDGRHLFDVLHEVVPFGKADEKTLVRRIVPRDDPYSVDEPPKKGQLTGIPTIFAIPDPLPAGYFAAALTCVRCGLVQSWRGILMQRREPTRLDPTPVTVGGLSAQEIHRSEDESGNWRVTSWLIIGDQADEATGEIRNLVPVGSIHGEVHHDRRAFTATLDADPSTYTGTGSTPTEAMQSLMQIVKP